MEFSEKASHQTKKMEIRGIEGTGEIDLLVAMYMQDEYRLEKRNGNQIIEIDLTPNTAMDETKNFIQCTLKLEITEDVI
jgi:hypothetical protein